MDRQNPQPSSKIKAIQTKITQRSMDRNTHKKRKREKKYLYLYLSIYIYKENSNQINKHIYQ